MSKAEKPVKFKIPKSLGACADRLGALRAEKSEAAKRVEAIDAEMAALKKHLINTLPASDASGVSGANFNVAITRKKRVVVEDRAALEKWVKRTGDFGVFTAAVSAAHIQDLWDAGKNVPGVGSMQYKSVSITKVPQRGGRGRGK